ncbi:outer membrane autotransporter protein [Mesorhizobium robiniae]|uniref:Outer membrane autotransporter protein n=1 Tax=Mesorhizobium robiniae TaxID=559315 RepID=A0ABV2GGB1_9HYPH
MRRSLRAQASQLALRSAIGIVAAAGASLLAPGQAWAACTVAGVTVQCGTTSTTDTTYPTNPPDDRYYDGSSGGLITLTVDAGTTVSGHGLAFSNAGTGGVTVTNNGTISVDAGNTPTAGGTAALSVSAAGGPIVYTGGSIINNGAGNAFDVTQTGGAGSVDITVSGNVSAATGEGITVRDVATSTGISVITNDVTALTVARDAIDAQSQSLTGNVTIEANGDLQAGNAGVVAAILPAAATGNVDVTTNGSIDARFGIDAENFGAGSTTVTTVGPINVTTGNGIFARTAGGAVTVTAGDVTSTGNTAIIARQTSAVGAGAIDVTAGNVSGTTGIEATNSGTGSVTVTANGTVTGTSAEGINANGNGAVTVNIADTVTGATRGLTLVGGTGGTGDISVTGAGGFVGGTGDAANILNNGAGSVTVDISGASSSTGGEGIVVRDTAVGGDISVTTGAVTALTVARDAIDVQTQSTAADVTVVANGDLQAGNAGVVAAILPAAATGNVDVTTNGSIDARFGIDAETFGTGSTTVTAVGPINVTTGNGIFAKSTGGTVTVTAGDVTSTGNTAIIARQTSAVGAGAIDVTAGNVSGTTGIEATNSGTGSVTVTANGTVTGTLAEGINANGNGAVTVNVANTVTGATRGLTLVGGTGGTGDISVTGAGGFVGGTGGAANIVNNGSGTVTVDIAGASSSTGSEGIVVRDTAVGGNISVTTGAVTALTAGSDAIDVQTQSTTADVTVVANGDLQAGNASVVAAIFPAAATGNVDVTTNGSIDARFGIDAENFGTGSTTVTTVGPINVTTGNGIFALATGGAVTVDAGDVTSTGNTAIIARQVSLAGAGAIDVSAGNVSGTTGIEATNSGTGSVTVTANGTVTGTLAEGIKATGNDAVTVNVADTVTGATYGLTLVGGTGGSGDISVTGAGGFVGGTGDAATILNNGAGSVTVDISGPSSSTGGSGIVVRDTDVGGDIRVTTGAVTALTAGKNAIDVLADSATADVTVVANGDLQAGNAGVVAVMLPGPATGNVSVTANGSLDARFGIDAENFGTGTTTVTAVGPITTTGSGIFARSNGGNITVTAGDVTSTGAIAIIAEPIGATAGAIDVTTGNVSGTIGIRVTNNGTGAIGITANGTVTGTAGEGINVAGNGAVSVSIADTVTGVTNGLVLFGGSSNISVTGAGGFVGGTGDAANIFNNGTGTVTVDISGASSSTGGEGIVVRDTALGGDISVTTGAVTALTAGSDAIDVQAQSLTGNVTIVADGNVQAGNAGIVGAIVNAAATGNVDVTTNGSIDARFGIDAENFGTGTTTVTAVGPITTTTGNGIFAKSTGGAVTVTAGDVTSTGNTAIVAQQTAAAGAGAVSVTGGNVSGTMGILTSNAGTGGTAISTNGTVEGDLAAISATSNAGHAIGITLAGATHSSALTATALAITTAGGATTLTNGGALTGRVELGDYADLVTNNASWRTGGTSLFGAGIDSVVNAAGASLVTAGNGAALETTAFSGLESLSSAGRLTMQDGGAGDRTLLSGNVTLAAGSTYAIDIGAALQSDLLHAAGAATITGSTLSVNMLGGLLVGTHYTVLTADGGLTGEFGSVTGLPAFLAMLDTYDANNAYLEMLKARDFADAGETRNQIATGEGLDSIPESGPLFGAVASLATDAEARDAFDQLSGEIHASVKGMLLEDSRFIRDAATNRISAAFGDAGAAALPVMAYGEGGPEMVAADTDRFAVWGQAFGSWGDKDSDGNAAAFDRSTGGLLMGADRLVGDWRVGLLGGYSHSSFDADDRQSSGDADSYHIGLYGGTNWGAIAFRTGAAYSWNSISTQRSVAFNGLADSLSADYDAGTAQVFGELAYKMAANRFHFEPFANLAYVSVHTDGFTEKGGAAALTSASSTTEATFTTLGLRASTDFALGGTNATARGMVGWRHAFGDVTPVSTFAFAGGDAFTIAGVPLAKDAAVVEVGFDLQMSTNATLGLSYTGQFGAHAADNGAKADLRVKF